MNLDDLKRHENEILLAEIGALIHDLGKLSKFFIDKKSLEGKDLYNDYNHSDILEYDLGNTKKYHPKNKTLEKKAQRLKEILDKTLITFKNEKTSLYQFLKEHHNEKHPSGTLSAFVKLLRSCDAFDSEEDRGRASDMQSICIAYSSNAFGHEDQLVLSSEMDYQNEREIIYDIIMDILDACNLEKIRGERRFFLEKLRDSFSKSLGMTARAANDVSLWEHSYMSASIMKALLCESIARSCFFIKEKEEISSNEPFKILSVYWDFFSFILQSHKMPDITGRLEVLNELKRDIIYLIETEYLLGNCIYEDEFGLHFLVPASLDNDNKNEIVRRIYKIHNEKLIGEPCKELKGIVTPYISLTEKGAYLHKLLPCALENTKKRSGTSFKPKWIEDWKGNLSGEKLVCNLCGKGLYCEGELEDICETCNNLRKIGRKLERIQTIFIDEIAWNEEKNSYENVALCVLDFDLENWLDGMFTRTLLMRKYNEKDLEILFEYYREGKEAIESFAKQGPLIGWIKSGSVEAGSNARISIINHINKYNKLGEFSRNYLGNIYSILVDIKTTLDSNDMKKAKNLLGMLNDEVIRIRNSIEKIEDGILHPDSEQKSKEKRIIHNSSNLNEVRESIFLKKPSASRLMRIWDNTKEFFEEIEEIVCRSSHKIERYSLDIKDSIVPDKRAYELKIKSNSGEIDAEGVFNETKVQIVTPHANRFIRKNKVFEIEITDKDWTFPASTFMCESNNAFTCFKSYRVISISPSSFMFLVTASKTPEILKRIKERYMEVFGKVYGKLPLNIGIIYFKRKVPFYTVLDSARRFLDHEDIADNTNVNREFVSTEIRNVSTTDGFVKVETDIGTTCIPVELGNGNKDYYHPYIFIEDGHDTIEVGNCKEKHAILLKKEDKIRICPSFFDFVFLDSNTRRFDIYIEKRRRPHPIFELGPRPYYLEDIDKFCKIWDILRKTCDNTQLNNFESILLLKIEEWNLNDLKNLRENEEFRNLVEASIKNILRIKREDSEFDYILNSVLSGMFFDVKELFHTILKEKLRGEENE
jgi:hypothetical protein